MFRKQKSARYDRIHAKLKIHIHYRIRERLLPLPNKKELLPGNLRIQTIRKSKSTFVPRPPNLQQKLKELQTKMLLQSNQFQLECLLCCSTNHEFQNCQKVFGYLNRPLVVQQYIANSLHRREHPRGTRKLNSLCCQAKLFDLKEDGKPAKMDKTSLDFGAS